jgi:hypothetical protein
MTRNNSGRSLPATKEKQMKLTKILGVVAAVAALALMAFASTASATTLEVGGVTKNSSVAIEATAEGSILLTDTFGAFANTCTTSTVDGATTTPFTGVARIGGPISKLTFENCTEDKNEKVVVDAAGYLTVEAISGTTNGTVFSDSAKVTTPSPFGKLTCTTPAAGTDVGKLTGVAAGNATMDISAVLSCGALVTAKWSGSYKVTSPAGLGVEA